MLHTLLGRGINLYNQFEKAIWQYLVISKRYIPLNPTFSLGISHTKSLICVQGNVKMFTRAQLKKL